MSTNKKFSVKTILIVVILLLVGVLTVLGVSTAKTYLSGASADLAPKNVVSKPSEDGKSAIVSWSSDKEEVGVVEYGTTPASLLLRAPETDSKTVHSVNLTPLKANTNYYFRIRVGEDIFDNNGIPYSFKTKTATEAGPTIGPMVTQVPTISNQSVSTTCNRTTDYNKDGVVNSLDYISCSKSTPTLGVGQTKVADVCHAGTDYNKDGVVNSLDVLKCLQDSK